LCLRVSGYISIDICGREWPAPSELHRIAEIMAAREDVEYELSESDVYGYLASGKTPLRARRPAALLRHPTSQARLRAVKE